MAGGGSAEQKAASCWERRAECVCVAVCGGAWGGRTIVRLQQVSIKGDPPSARTAQATSPSKTRHSLNDASHIHINHCQPASPVTADAAR